LVVRNGAWLTTKDERRFFKVFNSSRTSRCGDGNGNPGQPQGERRMQTK
jgi:hypothetical protein